MAEGLRNLVSSTINESLSLNILDQLASNMKGKTFHHHYHILYDLRTLLGSKKKNYLEIGTFNGGSALLMMQHPYETNIYCVDPLNIEDQKTITLYNFDRFNIYKRKVELITEYSNNFQATLRPILERGLTFDIIFIDGSHKYADVISDFVNYYHLLNINGFLVFDDYHDADNSPEVRKAVDNITIGISRNLFLGNFDVLGTISNYKQAKPIDMLENNCFIIQRPVFESDIQFAVVIATYKRSNGKSREYLRRSFSSLRKQKYTNFKVFLIGDRYEDEEEFLYFRNALPSKQIYIENLKVAYERDNCKKKRNLWTIAGANAMNVGLEKARSEGFKYMAHLDDDDVWHPNHLRNLAMAYEQFSNLVFACTKGILGDEIIPVVQGFQPGNFIPKGNDCFHSTISFRCDLIPYNYWTIDLTKEEIEYEPSDLVMLRNIGKFIKESKGKYHSIAIPHITCFRVKEHESA